MAAILAGDLDNAEYLKLPSRFVVICVLPQAVDKVLAAADRHILENTLFSLATSQSYGERSNLK